MSHRKYEAPRHGSMRFVPRKRSRTMTGRIRSFPRDDRKKPCHLTAFVGYKAGMTHIVRQLNRPGSKAHQKEIVEAVTIIETPPMIGAGVTGYIRTPHGLHMICTVWAEHLDDSFKRRCTKDWRRNRKILFRGHERKWAESAQGEDPEFVKEKLQRLVEQADVIRLIAHTQISLLPQIDMKKAHISEIQVNGGTVKEKVDFAYKLLEKPIPVSSVFAENESLDTIGVNTGKGWKGVISRWGVTRLPRKTHRGLRKVACIGAWHPARVQWTIPRSGQKGFHHRTEINKKIMKIGKKIEYDEHGKALNFEATTEYDLTAKNITPMGGFVHYGVVKQDFVMIKGSCQGPRKRVIKLRKSLRAPATPIGKEEVTVRWIDTSSKLGNGRFQTAEEKQAWFGKLKKDRLREAKEKADSKWKQDEQKGDADADDNGNDTQEKQDDANTEEPEAGKGRGRRGRKQRSKK